MRRYKLSLYCYIIYVFIAILLKHNFATFCRQTEHYISMRLYDIPSSTYFWYYQFISDISLWIPLVMPDRGI